MNEIPGVWLTRIIVKLIDVYCFAIDQFALELTPDRRFDIPTEEEKAFDKGYLEGYRVCLDILTKSLPLNSGSTFSYPSKEQVEEILKEAEGSSE